MAFSPFGEGLAVVGAGGMVRLYSPTHGQPVGAPIPADPGGVVHAVAFSPHGGLLASVDGDGTVRLWDVSAFVNPYKALGADVGPPTRQTWNRYAHGAPEPRICAKA